MEDNRSSFITPKVSVVIPVYNVEKWIGRCARSLFEQTLDEMEFIFVDDGSTDNSIGVVEDVLKEFPKRKHQVTILHQRNSGPSGQGKGRFEFKWLLSQPLIVMTG